MNRTAYKLHVTQRGAGRPVILLHGFVSTHRYWLDVAKFIEGDYQLYLPDHLGYGQSPKPRDGVYDLRQFAECLKHTFSECDFSERPMLVGHSMGALIALEWARLEPGRFRGLVLTSPTFFEQTMFHQQLASISLEGKLLTSRLLARAITAAGGWTGLLPSRLAARLTSMYPDHVVEDATSHHRYVYRKILEHAVYMDEVLASITSTKLPMHIVIGKRDSAASHALQKLEVVCKAHAQCQLTIVPGAHQVPLDHPDAVAAAIRSSGG